MDISEVVRETGVPASTLRFYEEKGLIRSTGRAGLKRLFKRDILERLALISLGRAAGFSLDEIAGLLGTGETLLIDRVALETKAAELDCSIRQLTAMRDGLRHAAVCPEPSHLECPTFRRFMSLAASGAFAKQTRKAGTGEPFGGS